MKNLSLLLCSLLLNGVFGDAEVKVSVKEGDSVTLTIKPEDINRATSVVWKTDKSDIIGKLTFKDKRIEVYDTPEKLFGDRLKLNNQTGSLTITNITSQHSGLYQLEIKSSSEIKHKTFRVSVIVSVMEGDSVTLQTGVTDGKNVKWKFKGTDITDSRFINCDLNNQTRDLNITNIRRNQSGEYEVRINGRVHRILHISIRDKMNNVSVMEGDSFTLTGVTDGKIDDVKWMFEGDVIADLTPERFPNCEVKHQTGDLIITNIRHNQSGEYEVRINGSSFILLRTYRVNVSDKPESVSVNVGSDRTLCHNLTDRQRDVIQWTFNGTPIVNSHSMLNNVPDRFSGRLHLGWTGCLIITKFRSEDSGLYKVNIAGSKHTLEKNFIVTGVFGDGENKSVKEGDSVTLKINPEEINRATELAWRFKDTMIAEIDLQSKDKPPVYPDERFRDRLNLERQNGSLTITNIRSEHSGEYKLEIISSSDVKHKRFNVSVSGGGLSTGQWTGIICGVLLVIGVVIVYRRIKYKQQKKNVTVKEKIVPERLSVTLETHVTKLQSDDVIQWRFKNEVIGTLKKNKISIDEKRFRYRLDDQTGSLIITNIRTEDAGLYKVKISSSSRLKSFLQFITGGGPSYCQFNVIVRERIKSVKLEGSVTLETGFTEIQTDDQIHWTFEDQKTVIAQMTVETEPSYVSTERFRSRLKMNTETGDLTISNITTELSGVYKAQIISSSRGCKDRDYRVVICVIAYKGESVTLNTESKIQRDSEIQWISEDETILVIGNNGEDRETKYTDDERYKDRLKMIHQTGDLTITDITQRDDGLYTFQQINSDRKISCRIFRVLVSDGHSPNHIKQNSGTEGNESTTVVMPLLNEAEDRL